MIEKGYEKVSGKILSVTSSIRNPVYLSITQGRVSIVNRSKHRTRSGCLFRKFWRMKID